MYDFILLWDLENADATVTCFNESIQEQSELLRLRRWVGEEGDG